MKKEHKNIFKSYLLVLLILPLSAFAEDEKGKADSTVQDTVVFSETNILSGTSSVTNKVNFENYLYQNPTKALFKSMVVPGWGQVGNKKYVKALVFFSFDAWMISKALHYKKEASDLRDKFESANDIDTKNQYYDLYSEQSNQRNKYTWYAVITSFISMFDAYVDAHLSGYPSIKQKDDLSIEIIPIDHDGAMVTLSLNF